MKKELAPGAVTPGAYTKKEQIMLKEENFDAMLIIMEAALTEGQYKKFVEAFEHSIKIKTVANDIIEGNFTLPSDILLHAFGWNKLIKSDGIYWSSIWNSLVKREIEDGEYIPDFEVLTKLKES